MTDIDVQNASREQIERGLALLAKDEERKRKIAAGEIKGYQKYSELTDEQKAARNLSTKKRNARITILAQKALAAGITVTEEEIEAAIA